MARPPASFVLTLRFGSFLAEFFQMFGSPCTSHKPTGYITPSKKFYKFHRF